MSDHPHFRRRQLIREAEGYLELGLAEQALEALDRLGDPWGESYVYYLRGEALRSLSRHIEAIQAFRDAVELKHEDYRVWLAMGWCYKRTDQLRRAIRALETALTIAPDEAIVRYNLACYWSLAEDKEQSLGYLAQALEMDARYRDLVHSESDFDNLRGDPDFQALTAVIV